ncbi:thiaminase II [Lactobacillus sp. ESL0731]|uniref:thiaminase II n=1 Tax=unclassified Lactobacillus TaxID=2620435 RepID=UPI0023F6B423|nr:MULTISPECIES: thiaminase II [unclassified Lactobacillus]WEV51057.1 thiaminase II [Lactobacillus sp. ESL0700]WEV62187.1 thiaminase II [Lactobacillus sp. ESL0731]
MTEFTDQLHQAASSLWQKSMVHPFVQELKSGELPMTKFRFYLLQDRYYLNEFSKFHCAIAAKTADQQTKEFLLAGAQDLKDSEIAVRERFFEQLKITPDEIAQTPIAPTAYAYVNHLEMTLARDGIGPAVASLVPCYWLYQEIGQKLADSGSPVFYYQEWIDTYDGDWYATNVKRILRLTNSLANSSSTSEREKMQLAFVRSSYYELQFWQMAYEQENWV